MGILFCCCASCSFLWFFFCFQRFWLVLEGCRFDLEIVWILHVDVGLIENDKTIFGMISLYILQFPLSSFSILSKKIKSRGF
jgi:hypothetical protein